MSNNVCVFRVQFYTAGFAFVAVTCLALTAPRTGRLSLAGRLDRFVVAALRVLVNAQFCVKGSVGTTRMRRALDGGRTVHGILAVHLLPLDDILPQELGYALGVLHGLLDARDIL